MDLSRPASPRYISLDAGGVMSTKLKLTPELERFARACVESGRFDNVSEVVRSGLRMLQDAEERRAAFVASLGAAREEGLREGLATVDQVEADVSAAIAAVRNRHG
jgi:antitoxin ParD1/3/4